MVEQYATLRKELKAKGDYEALRKLPRDSSPTRLKKPLRDYWKTTWLYEKIQHVTHCL